MLPESKGEAFFATSLRSVGACSSPLWCPDLVVYLNEDQPIRPEICLSLPPPGRSRAANLWRDLIWLAGRHHASDKSTRPNSTPIHCPRSRLLDLDLPFCKLLSESPSPVRNRTQTAEVRGRWRCSPPTSSPWRHRTDKPLNSCIRIARVRGVRGCSRDRSFGLCAVSSVAPGYSYPRPRFQLRRRRRRRPVASGDGSPRNGACYNVLVSRTWWKSTGRTSEREPTGFSFAGLLIKTRDNLTRNPAQKVDTTDGGRPFFPRDPPAPAHPTSPSTGDCDSLRRRAVPWRGRGGRLAVCPPPPVSLPFPSPRPRGRARVRRHYPLEPNPLPRPRPQASRRRFDRAPAAR
jgi:hypothetical protein